ncbi:MAG: bifunctional 4-hydroxy-2-oxoglutarate aldolase/2-dehydro-3-deoxy-phosphogluconate aldolase [Chloroflexi bacterium]|nr:bifunctional 4-hydroxy-2-oxoglutarate aldolase/2-dehydro-3-deoxy-phosphogluconate aldolase [Chloroflexota bacterium]
MARFDRLTVLNTMIAEGMVPLFYHNDVGTAQQIASAIEQGGGHLLEFTNRGDFAIEVFSALVKQGRTICPDLIIGAGSIDDAPTAALYLAHGANFIVGPTFDEATARVCNRRKVAYLPGCGSLNEIATAEEWGVEIVKLFPGGAAGGPDFVRDIHGPRPWARIMPTGGVSPDEDNLRAWFDAGVACVGMGSRLVRRSWVDAGDYASIAQMTTEVLERIRTLRSAH